MTDSSKKTHTARLEDDHITLLKNIQQYHNGATMSLLVTKLMQELTANGGELIPQGAEAPKGLPKLSLKLDAALIDDYARKIKEKKQDGNAMLRMHIEKKFSEQLKTLREQKIDFDDLDLI